MNSPSKSGSPVARLFDELNLAELSEDQSVLLENHVRPARFCAGETFVLEEGEVEDEVFLILSGSAVLKRILDGETLRIANLGPGDVAGEAHLLSGDAGTDHIVATEPVEVLSISRAALEKENPDTEPLLRALELRLKAARLRAATSLSHLEGDAILEVAGDIEEEDVPASTVLLACGEAPEAMTFLWSGRAEVVSGEGENRRVVAELLPGDSYGEDALLGGAIPTPSELTIEAATDIKLFHIKPEVLDRVIADHPESGAEIERQIDGLDIVAFLRCSGAFAGGDTTTLRKLAAAMEAKQYPAGTEIVREGEEGDSYYLVSRGRVHLDTDETEAVKVMDELGPGDGFGAEVLLGEGTYAFSATATEDTVLLALDGEVFHAVVRDDVRVLGRVSETLTRRQLPRRIEKWSAVLQETAEGEILYVIKDEERGRYYKLSERGYFLWEQMDGNATVRDLVMAYTLRYKTFSVEQVIGLVEALREAGFVHTQVVGRDLLPGERSPLLARMGALARRALYFTVPVKGFDPVVTVVYNSIGWILYTKLSLVLFAVLALSGLGVSAYLFFGGALPSWQPAAGWGILSYYGLIAALILVHEACHALTVKSYGREVRRAGFGFIFGTPFLYIDTSDMWMDSRRPRIAVSWAGPYLHLILGGVAAWSLLLFPELRESSVVVTLLVINYLFVIANLFPLLEFDGYYMLMDYLEIPRLRNKAVSFVGRQFMQPTSPLRWSRVEKIFVGFGVVSGAYMIFVTFQLLLLANVFVGHYAALVVGPVFGSIIGWTTGFALTLLLLWPSLGGIARSLRRKAAPG